MKKCSRCQKEKPSTEFHKDNSRTDGLQRYCKTCKKKRDFVGYGKYRGKYVVYYLPKHRYVGMTKNYKKRIQKHGFKGKDIEGHFALFVTKSKKIAHIVESLLHLVGFNGFRY